MNKLCLFVNILDAITILIEILINTFFSPLIFSVKSDYFCLNLVHVVMRVIIPPDMPLPQIRTDLHKSLFPRMCSVFFIPVSVLSNLRIVVIEEDDEGGVGVSVNNGGKR